MIVSKVLRVNILSSLECARWGRGARCPVEFGTSCCRCGQVRGRLLAFIKDHGGVYVAGGFNKTVALTGAAPPNRVVIFKFGGIDGAKKWWEGGGKKINDEIGVKYADFHVLAVEGIEAQ
jgi:uncharacterized protein (DUF1330 family)